MATLLVVRHGQAAGNLEHRFIGQSDVPLDDLGWAQAEALADRLSVMEISRIVASDLQRTVNTVAPLAARLGLEVETDPRLREIRNGEWTGLLPQEIANTWPDLWTSYVDGTDVLRPGGESWADVRTRVIEAAEELSRSEGSIVVCTHGGPALHLVMWAAGLDAIGNVFSGRFGRVENAAISTIAFPGPRLVGYNDTGHLQIVPDGAIPYDAAEPLIVSDRPGPQ
jgi:broad specificity phosphatase PhoE